MLTEDQNMVVERYVRGRESSLVERYMEEGPTALKDSLGVNDENWLTIFDYLVFNCNLLYKCVVNATEFFKEEYIKYGITHVREILDVVDAKYNMVFEMVFDYLAISHEGLFYHVMEHRNVYMKSLKKHGAEFVKKILWITKDKYEKNWVKVLDILLKATMEDIFSERTFDDGLKAFNLIYSGVREHRVIK